MMNNLIDRAKRVDTSIIRKQLAEMESYRLPVYLSMVFHNLKYASIKLLSTFVKSLSAAANETEKETWDLLLRRKESTLFHDHVDAGHTTFIENIKYCIRKGAILPFLEEGGEDYLSGRMIHTAAKILKKEETVGKSVYEVNDLIYTKFPDKKIDHQNVIRRWLLSTLVFAVAGLVLLITKRQYLAVIIAATVLVEIFDYVFVSRKLCILHLAKLIWLITSETGMNSSEEVYLPISSLVKREQNLLDKRMRAVHSLRKSQNVLTDEINRLTLENNQHSSQIDQNKESIAALRSAESAENERSAVAKEEENAVLEKKISENQKLIADKNAELQKVGFLLEKLGNRLIGEFRNHWNSNYKRISITDKAIRSFLYGCQWEDVPNVEKRFYEIEHTANPFEIAKRKNGKYFFEWLVLGGGVANIEISNGTDPDKVSITEMNCPQQLNESFATVEELKEALTGLEDQSAPEYEAQIRELQQWYLQESQKWKKEKKRLEDSTTSLAAEKTKLINEVENKQVEIDKLCLSVDEKTAECQRLQKQMEDLVKSGRGDQKEIENLQIQLKNAESERSALQQKYEANLQELGSLYEEIEKLTDAEQALRNDLAAERKEIAKKQAKIEKLKGSIVKKREKIQKLEEDRKNITGNLAVTKSLLAKAEGNSKVDKGTIEKLREQKRGLEQRNENLNEAVEKSKVELAELAGAVKKAEDTIVKQNDEIEHLHKTVAENNSQIVYDEQIYDALYDWILAAQEYIYIVAPFVSEYQLEKMTGKLKNAVRSNPDLKIKLLYGIQDKRANGSLYDSSAIEKARRLIPSLIGELGEAVSVRETNTHVKVVIVDDRKFMLGSANVMSFAGNYRDKQNTRSEVAIISENRTQTAELKKKYFNW